MATDEPKARILACDRCGREMKQIGHSLHNGKLYPYGHCETCNDDTSANGGPDAAIRDAREKVRAAGGEVR